MNRTEFIKVVDAVLEFMDDQNFTYTPETVLGHTEYEYVTFEEARTRFFESEKAKQLLSSLSE